MLSRKFSKVRIDNKLTMASGATLTATSATGVETDIDVSELAALQNLGATDLTKIDGITNGTAYADKAVVLNASKGISTITSATITTLTGTTANVPTVNAGASGTVGAVNVFPTTAARGKLILSAVANDGDTNVTLTNAAMGQASVISIPDPGASTANVLLTSAANDGAVVTATSVELNYNDITTLGTLAASKAWTSDANIDTVMPTGGLLTVQSGGAVTMSSGSTTTLSGAVVQAPVFVADATPYAVLAADSGKLHIILEQTNSITLNLPVIAAGLSYKFVMGGVATEAQSWVIVATTPSYYNGGVAWTDTNAVASPVPVYGNGTSHLTLTVTTPGAGTEIEIYSNGTEWFVHGAVISDATPAFT